jgi:Fic family protein
MEWNWQRPDWPAFSYDAAALEPLEKQFLLHSGELIGAFRHVGDDDRYMLKIELISDEALKTSEIEGEMLDRDSVQSSLRRQSCKRSTRPSGEWISISRRQGSTTSCAAG